MIKTIIGAAALIATTPAAVYASDVDEVVERVAKAYRVEVLSSARTIRLEEDGRSFYASHDYTALFHDLTSLRRRFVLDFNGQRASVESLTRIGEASYHGRSVVSDGIENFIDYNAGSYIPSGDVNFDQFTGQVIRTFDPLLAMDIVKRADLISYKGETMWLGRMHDIIELAPEDAPVQRIFVHKETGRISRMQRVINDETVVHYTFDHPIEVNGVAFAREFSIYLNDRLLELTINRHVALNSRSDRNAFTIDADISQEPERIDQSVMTVETISPDVVHVGMDGSYSTIFKGTDGLNVFNAGTGLVDRLAAYRDETGDSAPLRYVIIPDHHDTEMADVDSAIAAGATIIVTSGAKRKLGTRFPDVDPDRYMVVDDQKTINGTRILAVSATHAERLLVPISNQSNVTIQAYQFISPYKNAPYFANHMGVSFYQALQRADVEPAILLSAGGRKAIPWSDFSDAVAAYDDTGCHRNRAICKGF